jgi:hypothetical protein
VILACPECGKGEHAVEGRILVDGVALPPSFVEIMVEIACKNGRLVPRPEPQLTGEAAMVEPDPLP